MIKVTTDDLDILLKYGFKKTKNNFYEYEILRSEDDSRNEFYLYLLTDKKQHNGEILLYHYSEIYGCLEDKYNGTDDLCEIPFVLLQMYKDGVIEWTSAPSETIEC